MRRVLAMLGGTVLLAAVCYLAIESWVGAGESVIADETRGATESRANEEPEPLASRLPAAPGQLNLRILDPAGRAVAGRLVWVTSPEPPLSANQLMPEYGEKLAGDVKVRSHAGSARLVIPPGHWTWLRATGSGPTQLHAYRRLPPFSGERVLAVGLSAETRALHVFLLQSDLSGPAARRPVTVFHNDVKTGGPVMRLAEARTDAQGYVCFRNLIPAAYLICAPGAGPMDAPPATARLILSRDMPTAEMPVTLVVPEERHPVELRIFARTEKARWQVPPKLYFRRLGKLAGQLFPMRSSIVPGQREEVLGLPEAEYELAVQPWGALRIVSGHSGVRVRAEQKTVVDVLVEANPTETRVELVGLGRVHYPVTVYARAESEILDGNPDMHFVGPYRWPSSPQKIRGPSGPCYLIVHNQKRWISNGPVRMSGGRVRTRLLQASRLEVQWFSREWIRNAGVLVQVSTSQGTKSMTLAPRLLRELSMDRAALAGTLVVPHGPASIECLAMEDMRTLWKRRLVAKNWLHRVRVESQD